MEKRILKFHVMRGGPHFNPGHVTFIGFEKINEGSTFKHFFYDKDSAKWIQPSGNELDCQINEDGTGFVNYDGDYDSTFSEWEDQLEERFITALIKNEDGFWDEEEMKRIVETYYSEYL